MRHMLLAAFGALVLSGAAAAQQPQYQPAAPVQPAAGPAVTSGGPGCTNCGTAAGPAGRGFAMSGANGGHWTNNCQLGQGCQSGCGSLRSDLAFQFGTCKNFFAPCGPTYTGCGHGGLFGRGSCPTGPMNAPWGTGFGCPRAYDSYSNH